LESNVKFRSSDSTTPTFNVETALEVQQEQERKMGHGLKFVTKNPSYSTHCRSLINHAP